MEISRKIQQIIDNLRTLQQKIRSLEAVNANLTIENQELKQRLIELSTTLSKIKQNIPAPVKQQRNLPFDGGAVADQTE